MECVNTLGSYHCRCKDGMREIGLGANMKLSYQFRHKNTKNYFMILYRIKRVVLMSMSVSAFLIIVTKMLFARIQKQVSIVSAIKVTKVMVLPVMI